MHKPFKINDIAKKYRAGFIFLLLFFVISARGQNANMKRDTTKGFDFFINAGFYVENKKNANYYRGIPSPMEDEYMQPDISYIMTNYFYRTDIMKLIQENHRGIVADTFWLEELSNMRYNANFCFGIGARYRFTKNLSIGVVLTQATMTAHGVANIGVKIMEVNSANVLPYPLVGKERRTAFELTANYIFSTQSTVYPLLEGGMFVNNTKVISADLVVENHPFTMINRYGQSYDPTIPQTEITRRMGGIGYGFSAALGLRISFNKWLAFEPVAQFRLEKINLPGYEKLRPNCNFMIRLMLGDGFFARKGEVK